jgi:hypothetical protein
MALQKAISMKTPKPTPKTLLLCCALLLSVAPALGQEAANDHAATRQLIAAVNDSTDPSAH